jgi:hypothetical protein
MIEVSGRMAFADFLDGLARDGHDVAAWQAFVVAHYPNEGLEEIRRKCVRLSIRAGDRFPSDASDRHQLGVWAAELRTSCSG